MTRHAPPRPIRRVRQHGLDVTTLTDRHARQEALDRQASHIWDDYRADCEARAKENRCHDSHTP